MAPGLCIYKTFILWTQENRKNSSVGTNSLNIYKEQIQNEKKKSLLFRILKEKEFCLNFKINLTHHSEGQTKMTSILGPVTEACHLGRYAHFYSKELTVLASLIVFYNSGVMQQTRQCSQ